MPGPALRRLVPFPILAAPALALIVLWAPALGAADDEIEQHERALADIEQRVQDLERDLGSRRGRREDLLGELELHERHIADLARAGHQLEAMIRAQERRLEELRRRLAAERNGLERERAALGSLLRSAYVMGRGDRIRALLDQEDPSRLSRLLAYYDYLEASRVARVEAVLARTRALEELARTTREEKARLLVLARRQEQTRARLAQARDARGALLRALDETIASGSERVASLQREAERMRLLLEELERKARLLPEAQLRQEPLRQLRGHLTWPLAGADLLTRFGSPKGDGAQIWDGVLLQAREGAEVRAVYYGRVAYASWLRGFGLLLIIEHDDEYMTLYGHNQTLLKEPGEWVAAGDVIALSGSSGGRRAPGLYFAIRHRGRPLNPEHWCRHPVDGPSAPPAPSAGTGAGIGTRPLRSPGALPTAAARGVQRAAERRARMPVNPL